MTVLFRDVTEQRLLDLTRITSGKIQLQRRRLALEDVLAGA